MLLNEKNTTNIQFGATERQLLGVEYEKMKTKICVSNIFSLVIFLI